MASLYEIDLGIMKCFDEETGEIFDADMLEALEMERAGKLENIALYIKNLNADIEAFKNEISALDARKKSASNKLESLKRYLQNSLQGEKFETSKVKISYRNTQSVSVDIEKFMAMDGFENYVRFKDPEPDKTAIKEALKTGKQLDGCELVTNTSMQIK